MSFIAFVNYEASASRFYQETSTVSIISEKPLYFYITIYVCVPHFYDLSALVGCWSSVSIRRIIYKCLNVCPFDYMVVCGWALVNRFNHTSWVTAVTPTDRPKSVRNSCVIKVFGGVFMLSRCFFYCSVDVGVFVTGLSQISSFFSS